MHSAWAGRDDLFIRGQRTRLTMAISTDASVISIAEGREWWVLSQRFHLKAAHTISVHIVLARASNKALHNFKGQKELQLQSYPLPQRRRIRIFVSILHGYHRLEADGTVFLLTHSHLWLTKNPQLKVRISSYPQVSGLELNFQIRSFFLSPHFPIQLYVK